MSGSSPAPAAADSTTRAIDQRLRRRRTPRVRAGGLADLRVRLGAGAGEGECLADVVGGREGARHGEITGVADRHRSDVAV